MADAPGGSLPDARALIVAIAHYARLNPLPGAVLDDARAVQTALAGAGGYPAEQVTLLLDEQATLAGLRAALADLAARSSRDSTVFLYFSGHGGSERAGGGAREYLLPFDAAAGDPQALAESALSTAELSAALSAIPARRVVLALDCCHSGGIGQNAAWRSGLSAAAYESLRGQSRAILASSRSGEVSWVLPGADHSLFTHHLLDGLGGAAVSPDGLVHILNLFEYLQPRVTGEQPQQHPLLVSSLEDNFPVARSGAPARVDAPERDYPYDAYLAFTPADAEYVWTQLAPFLAASGARVAVTGVVEDPGVGLVLGVERAITQARRTVVVLSKAFLADTEALTAFQAVQAGNLSVLERRARILPLIIEPIDRSRLPLWLASLVALDLSNPYSGPAALQRLPEILKGPIPRT